MPTTLQLASGLGGAIGCDFRLAQNQLVFVEYSGKLSAINLTPVSTIVAQNTSTVLKGTFLFDFDSGTEGGSSPTADVFWEQETAVLRRMTPQNSAQIVNLGAVDFNSINAAYLQTLPYSTTPIPGNNDATNQLIVNDVFAVKTTSGNYAKVQVIAYGYDLTIRWVTYHIASGYVVLGTGYTTPEDVKVSVDGLHAYVTERSGDLVRVAFASANRSAATVVSTGINSPQQMFLDEAHNSAYVVEYAASGRLLKINLTSGVQTVVFSGLNFAIGLVLSSDLQYAYVSEQTTGPDTGRISQIQLGSATRTTLAKGLTAPFFLTWADAAQDSVLVAQRDPSNSILNVNVTSGATQVVAASVPTRPSSVALPAPGLMIICCDSVVEETSIAIFTPGGPLLMGIGFIPFNYVSTTAGPLLGTATTPAGSPYQVTDAPFGGSLPIWINFQTANVAGASFYQVLVDGVPHTDSFTNYYLSGSTYVLKTTNAATVGPSIGCYPVHATSDLLNWYIAALGDLLDSTVLTNGLHTIVLQFTNAAGTPMPAVKSAPLTILVNNQQCIATLNAPSESTTPPTVADACGVLHYGTNKTLTVSLAFTASQPKGYANYSFSLARGVTELGPPAVVLPSGPVSAVASPMTATVANLLGTCPTAGFAAEVYVAATMTNGYNRQSQYDAEALMGFVLTP